MDFDERFFDLNIPVEYNYVGGVDVGDGVDGVDVGDGVDGVDLNVPLDYDCNDYAEGVNDIVGDGVDITEAFTTDEVLVNNPLCFVFLMM